MGSWTFLHQTTKRHTLTPNLVEQIVWRQWQWRCLDTIRRRGKSTRERPLETRVVYNTASLPRCCDNEKEAKLYLYSFKTRLVHFRLSIVQGFSEDQVDCMCEALLQQYPGSRSRLVMLISSLSSSQLQRYDSEHLLRARAVVAFHTERFTELYAILTGSYVFHPAHHSLLQKVMQLIQNISMLAKYHY